MSRKSAVLAAVDVPPPMLDAHAHGKRLLLHRHAAAAKHFHRVVRTVSDRQNERRAGDFPRADGRLHQNGAVFDLFADGFHRFAQAVGADVRLCLPQNFFRRACCRERFQNKAAAHILDAGRELAVGKRPRAPFAELHVRFGRKHARCAKALDVRLPPVHVDAAFEKQRHRPRSCQRQRGKQPRRAASHHNGRTETAGSCARLHSAAASPRTAMSTVAVKCT